MFKLFIIKIFGLTDISDILKRSKEKQKKEDKKFWEEKLHNELDRLNREHSLELQEKDATISMLEDTITDYKSRVKEVEQKEFKAKKQIKENHFVVKNVIDNMHEFTENINKVYGKMIKISDSVEQHKLRIEQK